VGGRLTQFLHHWEKFTTDVCVLSVIRGGLDLVFQERPPLADSQHTRGQQPIYETQLLGTFKTSFLMWILRTRSLGNKHFPPLVNTRWGRRWNRSCFSQLLGAKPVDGLRLSQSLWAKSENLFRSASHVLGTAEFFLSAVGALLQGKEGDDLAEVKSLLQPKILSERGERSKDFIDRRLL
jgi:hypothetical protein